MLSTSPSRKPLLYIMTPAHTRSTFYSNALPYIALVTIAFYAYFAWIGYRSLYKPLESNPSTHIPAVEEVNSQNSEYKVLQEKLDRLKTSHGNEMAESLAQIDALNTTVKDNGYINFPAGPLDGAEDVVVVIKTGATEIYRTLPIHLTTTLTHTPNHLLFSDHEQQIAQYKIQDALDEVSEGIISGNKDFELYLDQKKFMALGQSPEYLELKGGWELDKYKNIHMMNKTWKQNPNAKWYLFIDADSYVMLSNLLPYLRGLDHTKRLYMGDVYEINNLKFAQGGTGYVISHGAMRHVMQEDPDMPYKFEQMAKDNCCGDYVLGEVMKAHKIVLSETYPNFCGEGPARIGFLPENHCQPVVTMHHMRPSEISDMWTFERRLARSDRYILFQDIFDHFIYPHLSDHRNEWDGMSPIHGAVVDLPSDLLEEKGKELSKEVKREKLWKFCEKTCKEKGEHECMQFQIQKEECKIFKGIALGYKLPMTRDDTEDFRSGWLMDRIEKVKNITCEQPKKSWPQDVVSGA